MYNPFSQGSSGRFRENVLTKWVAALSVMLGLALVFWADVQQKKKEEQNTLVAAPVGNILVEAYWNEFDPTIGDLVDADVDLAAQFRGDPNGSNEESVVFYGNKVGKTYNLLRDDLGCLKHAGGCVAKGEPTWDPANYEIIASRAIPAGEHCVSVHLYNHKSYHFVSEVPLPVKVRISLQKGAVGSPENKEKPKTIFETIVNFTQKGQEIPVQCFTTDVNGDVIAQYQSDAACVRLRYNSDVGKCSN